MRPFSLRLPRLAIFQFSFLFFIADCYVLLVFPDAGSFVVAGAFEVADSVRRSEQ